MPKLIITIDGTVDDLSAAHYVAKVIQQGRISQSRHGRCYCFVTTFEDGAWVLAERTAGGADTFQVSKDKIIGRNPSIMLVDELANEPDANAVKP